MQSAPSANPLNTPAPQVFVEDSDLVLYAALIGRKPMSKTLRESISDEPGLSETTTPVLQTPVAAPAQPVLHFDRQRISVWLHHVSVAAKKRLDEARTRLSI